MIIETTRKCPVCGTHAPIRCKDDELQCMTCEHRGFPETFPLIRGGSVDLAPEPRNRMSEEDFERFVELRWDQYVARDGDDETATWKEMGEMRREFIKQFALACINDAPN